MRARQALHILLVHCIDASTCRYTRRAYQCFYIKQVCESRCFASDDQIDSAGLRSPPWLEGSTPPVMVTIA